MTDQTQTISAPQETIPEGETKQKGKRRSGKNGSAALNVASAVMDARGRTDTGTILKLRYDELEIVHDDNARHVSHLEAKELQKEIEAAGVQYQPIGVRPKGENGLYRVVWGFRRAIALGQIQSEGVPDDSPLYYINAVVFSGSEQDYLLANMRENKNREDWTPIELAEWAQRQVDEFGMKKKDVATNMGMTAGNLSQLLALLTLPAEARRYINSGKMSVSAGYALTQEQDEAKQAKAVAEAIRKIQDEGKVTRADVRETSRRQAEREPAGKGETKPTKKDRTYKEVKLHLESLMDKIKAEDGGSEEADWEPPKGYQVLEAILDYSLGKRGSQKRLWDLISEL